MTRLLNTFRNLSRPSASPPTPTAAPPAAGPQPVGLVVERPRSHPHLLEAWSVAPADRRVRFRAGPRTEAPRGVGEMPRGRTTFVAHLGSDMGDAVAVEWEPFGGAVGRALTVAGPPLAPTLVCGNRVRLRWAATAAPRVRVGGLRWVGDRPAAVAEPIVVAAADGGWEVPDDWLGPDPVELRLTPLGDDHQGLTERVILPPRHVRVETVFRRVMLEAHGRPWRRLQVEVRVPAPLAPPRCVRIDWRPYDAGVSPGEFRLDWPAGATRVALDLPHVSARGDRVWVRFELLSGPGVRYAWLATDETGLDAPPDDVLLAAGGPECGEYEYTHRFHFPDGEPANVLVGGDPLPAVPGLGDGRDGDWPTTLLAAHRRLAADPPPWAEFAAAPQTHLLLAGEPDLRAIARRCGRPADPTVVGHLLHAWAEPADRADRQALARHWQAAADQEVDRWLAAVAAGAGVGRLAPFWLHRGWTDPDPEPAVACSVQLERATDQPLAALLPEVIPGGPLAGELHRAVEAEARLRQPATPVEQFAPAALARDLVLAALADHWAAVLPDDPAHPGRPLVGLLRAAPADAACVLSALRRQPESLRLRAGRWPVFEAERESAARDLRERDGRDLRRRAAADWCRILIERRVLPPRPWHGLLPADRDTRSVLAAWEAVRPGLPTDAPPPPAELTDALAWVAEVAADAADDTLAAVASGLRENAPAVGVWLR